MGRKHAERQTVIAKRPQACFDALVDFEGHPGWHGIVKACAVRSRDRDGRARRVSFEVEAAATPMTYTLDLSYESPHLITWRFVEGDVRDLDGEIVLEDRGDGTTLATLALRGPAGAVSGPASVLFDDGVMRQSVEDLKARVETGV